MRRPGLGATLRRYRNLAALAALAGFVALGACADRFTEDAPVPDLCPACEPTLESVQAIFRTSCASSECHDAEGPAAGLDLQSDGVLERLTPNVKAGSCTEDQDSLIVPADPEASLLYQQLVRTSLCKRQMPPSGPLCDARTACIREWIASLPNACPGVDLATDPKNCGQCGNACQVGISCAGGTCQCPGVDLATDPKNCGQCGFACQDGISCAGGTCQCPSGTSSCSGACADTATDPAHCGASCTQCPAGASCVAGACVCGAGTENCGGSCVETTSNPANCGGCGKACSTGQVCAASACSSGCGSLTQCGQACVDTQTSPINCGACGTVCQAGQACTSGKCGCGAGLTACPSGCLDVTTDTANCGACGKPCGTGLSCSAGQCACNATSVSFSGAIQPIFTASCAAAGCHAGIKPAENLNLSSGKAYAQLVGVTASQCGGAKKRVVASDPAASYLMSKLANQGICFGTEMPKKGTKLAQAQIDTISSWICSGAPNN